MHGARSVPRASSAERVLLVPEPGKPVVASFALEIPLVIRPLGACCNSRSLKSGRKRKKRPVDARKPISTPSTADGHSMASAMACRRSWPSSGMLSASFDRRRTRAQVVQPPCTVGVVGRRKTTCISFCANSSCCGHCHATPESLPHGGMYAATRSRRHDAAGRSVTAPRPGAAGGQF